MNGLDLKSSEMRALIRLSAKMKSWLDAAVLAYTSRPKVYDGACLDPVKAKMLGVTSIPPKLVSEGSASDFASQKRYDEIKAFFAEHEVPCPRVIQQALESVKINVDQWKRDEKSVGKFLHKLLC
ncbi:Puromycin-sensitive aminopeptidase [Taenia solium]|eukprot:TsM_001091100 transcript=TsM_001091100 gene=TsM_001091100